MPSSAIEFIKFDSLSEEELNNYEQAVAFIKGVENPFRLKPSRVVELVSKKLPNFNMPLHTKCWKYYEARPREIDINYKGDYASYMEGFDGYLYSMSWVKFLIEELRDVTKLEEVKMQAI
ncbi:MULTISPECIES: hypothetical protein [Pseudoalteromonas]|uniref:Uncharacterized protein n=1 Tax=Pseudoalteromonas amylolytica TaxID=1859457 RepID=A0A1S1MSF8_9GAMM|nr:MULTISPECIES: hypothetical protein [Pseudoalteromonas]OHU88100.1 hypothetical protein BFC16_11965 [Pseudoalteromonas sp. JW3]OHU91540.1 hypothetical protein BET10_12085 [Pseudoalteromonas amylolytica]